MRHLLIRGNPFIRAGRHGLLHEGVDRNYERIGFNERQIGRFLHGGVDRNHTGDWKFDANPVSPLYGGVDRNRLEDLAYQYSEEVASCAEAWIETSSNPAVRRKRPAASYAEA